MTYGQTLQSRFEDFNISYNEYTKKQYDIFRLSNLTHYSMGPYEKILNFKKYLKELEFNNKLEKILE